uniref:Uncharacterized protein n=1 Tax=Chromera velia CCMP2878 TaxID=1169474 RepID=A0A0G4HKV1_9ALVE|eukprot:Cvel_7284.t1-p1 / transcript=Cvel_7284.t1 / gene=Cvel_7284 / organism=Chromera_velia_CCMP2878 / gene_product=hypothetical protein / transcript_product=hypothetical protein / location=Cvel_scaffold376:54972-58093(+) / protein_length=690 / sequence_SO=supercontig / SO=protein_coding / is_pseudo=false
MKDGEPEVDYLKTSIGHPLAEALRKCSQTNPAERVRYLIDYLRAWAKVEGLRDERKESERLMKENRAKYATLKAKYVPEDPPEVSLAKKIDAVIETVNTWDWLNPAEWESIVQQVQKLTQATGAYLGQVDLDGPPEDSKEVIRYTHAAPETHKFLTDCVLPPGEGVTWETLTKVETEEGEAQPAEEGEAEAKPEGPAKRLYKSMYVEEVIDTPAVKFFGMTNLGSYVAVPIVYTSVLTVAALAAAKERVTKRIAAKAAHREAEEKRAAAAAEAEEKGEGGEGKEGEATAAADATPPEELPVIETDEALMKGLEEEGRGLEKRIILAIDTCGQVDPLTQAHVNQLERLSDAVVARVQSLEKAAVLAQAENALDEKTAEKAAKGVAVLREAQEGGQEKAAEEISSRQDEEDSPYAGQWGDQVKSVLQKHEELMEMSAAIGEKLEDSLLSLSNVRVMDENFSNAVAALLLLLGIPKAELTAQGHVDKYDPIKMQLRLDKKIPPMLKAVDLRGPKQYAHPTSRFIHVRKLVDTLPKSEDTALVADPGLSVLCTWLHQAVSLRMKDLQVRMEQRDAAEAAYAEALEKHKAAMEAWETARAEKKAAAEAAAAEREAARAAAAAEGGEEGAEGAGEEGKEKEEGGEKAEGEEGEGKEGEEKKEKEEEDEPPPEEPAPLEEEKDEDMADYRADPGAAA